MRSDVSVGNSRMKENNFLKVKSYNPTAGDHMNVQTNSLFTINITEIII